MLRSKMCNAPPPPNPYPCLKKLPGSRQVVLFTRINTGTLVSKATASDMPLGHFSSTWDEHRFTKFIGTVELTND